VHKKILKHARIACKYKIKFLQITVHDTQCFSLNLQVHYKTVCWTEKKIFETGTMFINIEETAKAVSPQCLNPLSRRFRGSIGLKLKLRLKNTIIDKTLTYALETWILTKRHRKQIHILKEKCTKEF
jgi:hypothetical protein